MGNDPKALVATGYNAIAEAYLDRFRESTVRDEWLGELTAVLPEGARVLDLGCGAGTPVATRLVASGHQVVGVDASSRQLQLARRNVPDAEFLLADMTTIAFDAAEFDGIAAFYSITHVPGAEQRQLVASIAGWLRPGGAFVGSFGAGMGHDSTNQWLGAEMFFGHCNEAETLMSVVRAGLEIVRSEVMKQDNEDQDFLWLLARKPHV